MRRADAQVYFQTKPTRGLGNLLAVGFIGSRAHQNNHQCITHSKPAFRIARSRRGSTG